MKSAMHPEAREEFLAAIDYYNNVEPGLGMAFYSEQSAASTPLRAASPTQPVAFLCSGRRSAAM